MKAEVKRLLQTFPNLKEMLINLRNQELSFREITEFFNDKGFNCSSSLIKRLYNKYDNNNNLITLCINCHKETFGKESKMAMLFQDIVRTHRRL